MSLIERNSQRSGGTAAAKSLQSCPTLCDPVDRQALLSLGFSRQEYWSGLPFPPPGDLPDPGIKPRSPALQADSLPLNHQGSPQRSGDREGVLAEKGVDLALERRRPPLPMKVRLTMGENLGNPETGRKAEEAHVIRRWDPTQLAVRS